MVSINVETTVLIGSFDRARDEPGNGLLDCTRSCPHEVRRKTSMATTHPCLRWTMERAIVILNYPIIRQACMGLKGAISSVEIPRGVLDHL